MNLVNLVVGSTEFKRSTLLSLVKVVICFLFRLKFKVEVPSFKRRYIIALDRSYKSKPDIYNQIAASLDAGVITCTLCIFNDKSMEELDSAKELIFWSDVQILSRFIINKYVVSGQYSVFQHGALSFDQETLSGPASLEWRNTRAKTYYTWSRIDAKSILSFRPDVNLKVIATPTEKNRRVVPGYGFATRGVEYFRSDFQLFNSNFKSRDKVKIYFHPSYSRMRKFLFLLSCRSKGCTVFIGGTNEISKDTVTRSKSIQSILEKNRS